MSVSSVERPVSALRQRMLEEMAMRGLRSDTQHEYIRFVRGFAAFLGRPPDTTTAEDIRRFQIHQRSASRLGRKAIYAWVDRAEHRRLKKLSLDPLGKFTDREEFLVVLRCGVSAAQAGAGLKLVTRSI